MGNKFSSSEELVGNHPKEKLQHKQRPVVVNMHSVLKNCTILCRHMEIRMQDESNLEQMFREYRIPHKRG